ncbi:MAG: hypothetical protein V7609_2115 [Verrucomicrobiota bacterium]
MLDTAHEICNLLTVINGWCNLGAACKRPPEICFDMVLKASAKIEGVLANRLRAASASHGRLDLNAIIPTLVDAFVALPGPNVETLMNLEKDLPLGPKGDAGAFYRALLNLALNARKAMMPTGGVLRLETKRIGGPTPDGPEWVRVTIADTGYGMSETQVAHLWNGDLSPSREHGRGLLIVRTTVEELGGSIEVFSREGMGTTFDISLPIGQRDVASSSGPRVA